MAHCEQESCHCRSEITRLNVALDEASQEKIQAAQYGLQVLEEKQMLEAKLTELETSYDTAKHELEEAKKVPHPMYHRFIILL